MRPHRSWIVGSAVVVCACEGVPDVQFADLDAAGEEAASDASALAEAGPDAAAPDAAASCAAPGVTMCCQDGVACVGAHCGPRCKDCDPCAGQFCCATMNGNAPIQCSATIACP